MAPTREIINMMKGMENNIKTHIQETIEEALKRQEIKFNNKIDEVFSKLKDQEKRIEDVMKSQKFLNDEFEYLKNNVSNLMKLDLQKKTDDLMKENQCLKDQLIEEEKMRDDLDQYNRRENLEFHGIPLNPNEDTNHIIKTMAKKLNIDLKENDISTSHRLPKSLSNNPPIIIARFTNRDIRNLIFQKRKNLIGVRDYGIDGMTKLFINENLTPRRKKLFSLAYKKKINSKYQFLWTYNGDIFIRKNTTSERIKITCKSDIDQLL